MSVMADIISKEKRSEVMSRIKSKDTTIEIMVRKFLWSHGFRYRKNDARFPGKPDIVLPKYKTVIFIHGCFWHKHEGCKNATIPKTRTEFWLQKINGNVARDEVNIKKITEMGWHAITVWECELNKKTSDNRLNLLITQIQKLDR